MNFSIEIEDAAWEALPGLQELVDAACATALRGRTESGEIFVLFTSDEEIRLMNHQWRDKDRPTNVLSFPAATDMPCPHGEVPPLGDVVLAYGTVAREATQQGKTLAHHTTHLIVHGVLHLLGYDHENDHEAEEMENEERLILARLGIADPYRT